LKSYVAYRKDEDYPDFFEWYDEHVTVLERIEFEDGYSERVPKVFFNTAKQFHNHEQYCGVMKLKVDNNVREWQDAIAKFILCNFNLSSVRL
jgi:hypothetical protein